MEELDVPAYLATEDLFMLFKRQLKKDFEGAGLDGSFADQLPAAWEGLKLELMEALADVHRSAAGIQGLLYRVDISEAQIEHYKLRHRGVYFEEVIAELIAKRVLQKVILKKRFSE